MKDKTSPKEKINGYTNLRLFPGKIFLASTEKNINPSGTFQNYTKD